MPKKSGGFISNVFKLVTGSVFAQGLGILVAPILTRIFAPDAFGVSALFASITSITCVVACLRYERSIMLPKTDEEAANLLGVSLCFVLTITAITTIIIFFADDIIARLLNSPELKKYLWLIPIYTFVSGVFLALNYWTSRTKHFGWLSIARVVSSTVAQATKLGFGFAGHVSGGVLIGANILGSIVSTSVLGGQIWRKTHRWFKRIIRWEKMIAGLKRYKKFPIFTTWSVLLNTVSRQMPIFILAIFFSPTIVGFYAIGWIVLSMPSSLVGEAVAQVFLQRTAEARNRTYDLHKVVENVFKRLVSLSLFPFLLLVLNGKDAFIFVFGARWTEAGVYIQILSLAIFFSFISSPISVLFTVLEKQDSGLIFNVVFFSTSTIALVVGGLIGDVRITIFLFAVVRVACYLWLLFWLFSSVGLPFKRPLYYLGKYSSYCLPMLGITAMAKWGMEVSPLGVFVIGGLSAILYYVIILKQDKELQNSVRILFCRVGFNKYIADM